MPTQGPESSRGRISDGGYLRNLRKAKRMSQKELGQLLGYKKDNEIRGFESGERLLTTVDLARLRDALKMTSEQWTTFLAHYGIGVAPSERGGGGEDRLKEVTYVEQGKMYAHLETEFYRTNPMRKLRREAADELTSKRRARTYTAFDDLANWFDFVGTLLRQGRLDEYSAHSSFYRRAAAFWDAAQSRGVITRARQTAPRRWNDYEEALVQKLEAIHAKTHTSGKLSQEERDELLARERQLPHI